MKLFARGACFGAASTRYFDPCAKDFQIFTGAAATAVVLIVVAGRAGVAVVDVSSLIIWIWFSRSLDRAGFCSRDVSWMLEGHPFEALRWVEDLLELTAVAMSHSSEEVVILR